MSRTGSIKATPPQGNELAERVAKARALLKGLHEPSHELDVALWDLIDNRPTGDIGHGRLGKRDPTDTIAFDLSPLISSSLDALKMWCEDLREFVDYWEVLNDTGCWFGRAGALGPNGADINYRGFNGQATLEPCLPVIDAVLQVIEAQLS